MKLFREQRWIWAGCGTLVVAAVLWAGLHFGWWTWGAGGRATVAAAPHYVGRETCAECHAKQQAAWTGSHHDLAMQEATDATVLGDFHDVHFTHFGVTSDIFRRDGRFMVRTDGSDGKLADFEVRYTFGVEPLQQYLVEMPGGRLQALPVAWDSRPQEQGGQRWFHLYPDEAIGHDDELHWTRPQQNWNYMCAECHSTNLQRNYDAAKRTYATTWSEIDVSCEACHGPGSNHVAWAKDPDSSKDDDASNKGLVVRLDERRGVTWTIDASNGKPVRSKARLSAREIDTCARCHSRRGQIWDAYVPGRPIGETHRVALLDSELYYPDGQIHDEVYEYGSFLQSRMHAAGVTCGDCHEPHSLKLRAPGSAVCLTCHQTAKYQSSAHHHHASDSTGAQCIECHMPGRNYMVVDQRRDHSLSIPRPDLSATLGTPDACTSCHTNRKPGWAAAKLREWFGKTPIGLQRYGEIFHDGDIAAAGTRERLLTLAQDDSQPGIARASALARLDRIPGPEAMAKLATLLKDPDPLVRRAAVAAHYLLPVEMRSGLVAMLDDPVRDVRLEAVPLILDVPREKLQPGQLASRDRAIAEYESSQRVNADRPESHVNLGLLWAGLGQADEAQAAFKEALSIDSRFVPAAVNLADLHRAFSQEAEAEAVLRKGLEASPDAAALHHALGLLLVRTGRSQQALDELQQAAAHATESARYGYVYAVALENSGRRAEAIKVLRSLLSRRPNDRDALWALATWQLESGDHAAASESARRLAALEPDDPDVH
ncbi:MAG: tetratricopeptide repeat protein, partial [Burkholderiales bacterium]